MRTHGALVLRGIDFDDLEFTGGGFCFGVDGLFQNERMTPIEPLAADIVDQKDPSGRRMEKPHIRLLKVKHACRKVGRDKRFLQVPFERQLFRKPLIGRDLERVVEFYETAHSEMPGVGFEPTSLAAGDFKSPAYTVPPPGRGI